MSSVAWKSGMPRRTNSQRQTARAGQLQVPSLELPPAQTEASLPCPLKRLLASLATHKHQQQQQLHSMHPPCSPLSQPSWSLSLQFMRRQHKQAQPVLLMMFQKLTMWKWVKLLQSNLQDQRQQMECSGECKDMARLAMRILPLSEQTSSHSGVLRTVRKQPMVYPMGLKVLLGTTPGQWMLSSQ